MKHDGLWAGLEGFDWVRQLDGERDPALREDIGVIHAVHETKMKRVEDWPRDVYFQRRGEGPYALCRRPVPVVLPTTFDDGEEEVCRDCAAVAARRAEGVQAWEADLAASMAATRRRRAERDEIVRENERWEYEFALTQQANPELSEEQVAELVDRQIEVGRARDDAEFEASLKAEQARRLPGR